MVLSQLSYCPGDGAGRGAGRVRRSIILLSVFLQPPGGFAQGPDELVDVVFEDHQADPLMAVVLAFVLRLHDVDEPGSAGLFLEVEEVSSLPAGYPLAVDFFRGDGTHLLCEFGPDQTFRDFPGNSIFANITQISNKINRGTAINTWVTTSGGVRTAAITRMPIIT